jgi:signal transduction histidine kinase/CheY-like chemotaxis protein
MKIRDYLALMIAGILIPVIAFSAISFNMLLKAEREAALKGVHETARTALVSIDRELTNTEAAVRMLATSPYLAEGDLKRFYQQARYADQAGATWTALLDENGQQLMNTAVPFGTPMPDAVAGPRVAVALRAGAPQVSNLIRGAVTHALLVVVDVPVTTAGGKHYVITQGYRVEHFHDVLSQINTAHAWLTGVFDRNGITIARKAIVAGDDEQRADLREAIRNRTVGVIHNSNDNGVKLYTVLERSNLSGWTVAVGVPETDIEAAARTALTVYLLGLLAAIGSAALAAVFFARRLSNSVGAAARLARALERGEAMDQAGGSSVAEVDAVQAAIVAAANVIGQEKHSRQLAEAERELLFASEHAARTMAERQNRAKDEFLAMLGHELRNPLSAIVNAVGLVGMKNVQANALRRAHEIIDRQSQHLSRIIDDLLDVGRVNSGKILLEKRQVRLDTMVATFVATLRETGRGVHHRLTVSAEPAWVDADPTRLEQIVANLLDNAIKYTPAGGSIAVVLRSEGGHAVLSVRDSGVGIAPELMPFVFDLFVQGTRALDRPQGGLGVGLALVRRLAEMHGGSVGARSEGLGKGSEFTLRLPLLAQPEAHIEARAAVAATMQRVLLIEDNEDGRDTMQMMLASHGYRVAVAMDGYEGLRMAMAEAPDIALIDIGLPGIDGYEVARRLRADPQTCHVRMIALTGYGLEADQQSAIDAGFDMHLVKPVELERLIEAIETAGGSVAA